MNSLLYWYFRFRDGFAALLALITLAVAIGLLIFNPTLLLNIFLVGMVIVIGGFVLLFIAVGLWLGFDWLLPKDPRKAKGEEANE